MNEPDIVKILREEERLGLLNSKEDYSTKNSKNKVDRLNEIEFILNLQNGIIDKYLVKIKEGKIKTNHNVIFSLYELKNYYNSYYWKQLSNNISIDKLILSYIHLVNSYVEDLESSLKNNNNQKNIEIKKENYL
ncbi:hypothetical protein AYK20_08135 [Thermoplasmatales archaeon SG8-52-1]|nr:MAG: hypothetical protein AYK20_08135 [Thermoplasmatales archaeon SG8-52-1]